MSYPCPHCRQSFIAPPSVSATHVHCPHCRQTVEVPATPASRWFLARNKKKLGPYTWRQLLTLAKRGDIGPSDMLLQEGTKQWLHAGTVAKLFGPSERARSKSPMARLSTASRVAVCAGAAALLLLSVGLIAGYFLHDRRPVEIEHTNRDKISDDKRNTDGDRATKNDTGPKKEDVRPKIGDTKKPAEEKPPQPKQNTIAAEQFVEQINHRRRSAGLREVSRNEDLSSDCLAHAKYLAQNIDQAKANGANVHAEDPKEPGYSAEGDRAARNALISFAEPTVALEQWMGQLLSRVALLDPELQRVGVGVERNGKGDWIVVLGRGEPIVVYPAPRQTDVPLSFGVGPELPDKTAAGFPITITFPPNQIVTAGAIELRDDKGNTIDGWLSSPEKPARPKGQRNTVTLIAKAHLRPDAVYQVQASAQLDGKAWRLDWSFRTEDDADIKGVRAKKALAKVNAYRADAGLKPVTLDESLSRACLKHARYLVINEGHPDLDGLKAHDETLTLPGASEEGKKAGLKSNIAIGGYDPLDGVDAWMATLYHRVPIVEPNLERVGFACVHGRRQGWVTVLNVVSGVAKGPRPFPVFYPADSQMDVQLNFPNDGETPNPIPDDKTGKAGYPITASFPPTMAPVNAIGKLTDSQGKEVLCWFSSPEKVANPKYEAKRQSATICMIPKEPLKPNATFHVHLQGQLDGKAWEKKWKFTTGAGGLSVAQAKLIVFERINHYRAQAGLVPVTPDEEQGRACQLHAEYLVQNTLALANDKASPNDEDPLLPGYTREGMLASRQSDVFTNAPTPLIQIDDIMSTFSRRVYLLDPTLQRVGYGCAHDIGRGWRCVLDLNGGRGDPRILVYPAPKQQDVPLLGFDRIEQARDKPGFPISVIFPAQAAPRKAQAVLTDGAGKNVNIAISSLERPLNEKQPRNVIGVHPLTPLQPGQTYSVTVAAIVNGSEWRQEWQFTTTKKAN
jgi:uncharacterized protein YkwD